LQVARPTGSYEKGLRPNPRITGNGMIDRRALQFLFVVLMAAFAAIALIILISGM